MVQLVENPCCAAEALRKIRQVNVGGIVVGIWMLDILRAGVKALDLGVRKTTVDELLKRMKMYNSVPKPAEELDRVTPVKEFGKYQQRGG